MCFGMMLFSGKLEANGVSLEYEKKLFNHDNVMEVNILMDADKWQEMLDNAINEEYARCDVEVNGKTFYSVAVRPKGNTSLSSIAMDPDTDRYSFKLEFDRYIEGQTCFGLDKLILNNNYSDATNMKEALIYDMYEYIGADASLYNFAKISVNGEYWGVYLALEAVEDSFMLRNYGTEDGKLYKPETMGMGGGDKGGEGGNKPDFSDGEMPNFGNMQMPDMRDFGGDMPDLGNGEIPNLGDMQISDMGNGKMPDFADMPDMGGFGGMGGGANLNYTDDDLDSYSTIWESAVNNTTKADHKRVVTALKNISEGNDLEKYMDIDNLLKYMAVHVFSVNEDSLSGMMAHNYYLYEHDGRLNMLPWDYNLILGGMGSGGNASGTINDPIDTPFSATKFFDKLLENEKYLAKYHEYLQKLTEKYVDGGGFDAFYDRTRQQIDELVSADPTAFYSGEEYETAVVMLKNVVQLRSNSIQGQLDGTIPSTSNGQQEKSESLVNTDGIDLSVMGTMNMGGGSFGDRDKPSRNDGGNKSDETQTVQTANTFNDDKTDNNSSGKPSFGGGEMPDLSNMPDGFQPPNGEQIPDFGNGEIPDFSNMPDGFQPPNGEMPDSFQSPNGSGNSPETVDAEQAESTSEETTAASDKESSRPSFGGKGDKDGQGGFPGNKPNMSNDNSSNIKSNLIMIGASFVTLVVALAIAKFYRRKNIRK